MNWDEMLNEASLEIEVKGKISTEALIAIMGYYYHKN